MTKPEDLFFTIAENQWMDPDRAARYVVEQIDDGAAEGGLSREDAVAALEHAVREAIEETDVDVTIERQVLALLYAERTERALRTVNGQ